MRKALLLALLVSACGAEPPPLPEVPPATYDSPEEFLAAQEGKVVVALLGMEGCAATRRATAILEGMASDLPEGVVLARIDVPPPGGATEPVEDWPHGFYYDVDWDRDVAGGLDFFYYPTLYLLDRDGEVRYAGGCDEAALGKMVREVTAEKDGAEKKLYTLPLPPEGSPAPGFQAKGLGGETVDLTKAERNGPTLLFFTSADCPFSTEALGGLSDLEFEFEGNDLRFVTVEKARSVEAAKRLYEDIEVPGVVIHDVDGAVSKLYGVEPVPFFFVIDEAGKIAARGPYTAAAATMALASALGVDCGELDSPEGAG